MGMFIEADHHPFIQADGKVVEETHGGSGSESWRDENGHHEYVRPAARPRGTFIRRDGDRLTA